MKAIGKVLSTHADKAIVVSKRESACSSCHNCEGRQSCHVHLIFGEQQQEVKVDADNLINASPGDIVELESDTSLTLTFSAIIFIVPILLGFVVYFVSDSFFKNSFFVFFSVIVSVLLSFCVLSKLVDRFVYKNIGIKVVKILEESDKNFERK